MKTKGVLAAKYMLKTGVTLKKAGKKYGISRQAVQQALRKFDSAPTPWLAKMLSQHNKIMTLYSNGYTSKEIAKKINTSHKTISCLLRTTGLSANPYYSEINDHALITKIRVLAKKKMSVIQISIKLGIGYGSVSRIGSRYKIKFNPVNRRNGKSRLAINYMLKTGCTIRQAAQHIGVSPSCVSHILRTERRENKNHRSA
jgi:uncharacterized protein YerC